MALSNSGQLIVSALPETGEIPFADLRTKLTLEGKFRALNEFHEARRAKEIYTGFRNGVLVVSRFPIAREARSSGLSANQGVKG
jgi:hypothetical protein